MSIMNFDNHRPDDEYLEEILDKVTELLQEGINPYEGMSYLDGVKLTIEWVLGQIDDAPIDEDEIEDAKGAPFDPEDLVESSYVSEDYKREEDPEEQDDDWGDGYMDGNDDDYEEDIDLVGAIY